MKILITGGAGFMGSNFIHYILKKYPDYRVVNLDKLTYCGNLENLCEIENDPRYQFIKGDITDEKLVDKIVSEGVEVIINFAAETHVDRSIMDPKAFLMTDVVGTYTLLETAKKHNIKRYVQVSTDEVYGEIEEGKFTEESPFDPRSPYSASKAGGDHLVKAYHTTYGLPTISTHSCNFYGPYQYPEKLIPLFITNLLENKKVPVYGEGAQSREWIYAKDYCRALDLIVHKGETGEVYNIGTSQEKKNIETTKEILSILGQNESMIEYVKDRPGHDFRYAVDWSKLKTLGWEPAYKFEDGLRQTIEWYENNREWWKKLKSGEYWEYYRKQYNN